MFLLTLRLLIFLLIIECLFRAIRAIRNFNFLFLTRGAQGIREIRKDFLTTNPHKSSQIKNKKLLTTDYVLKFKAQKMSIDRLKCYF